MPRPTQAVIVRHPEVEGAMVALNPGEDYAEDDVLVTAYPWAFEEQAAPEVLTEVKIEAASAAPGERRGLRVRAGAKAGAKRAK